MTLDEHGHDQHATARHEGAVIVSGLLVFVASFLPQYGVTFAGGEAEEGVVGTFSAWHNHLAGLGVLLVMFSLVVTAIAPFLGEAAARLPGTIAAAVLACAGAALVVVKSVSLPNVDVPGTDTTLRWGGWVLLVLVILHAMVTVLRVVHSGAGAGEEPEVH